MVGVFQIPEQGAPWFRLEQYIEICQIVKHTDTHTSTATRAVCVADQDTHIPEKLVRDWGSSFVSINR